MTYRGIGGIGGIGHFDGDRPFEQRQRGEAQDERRQ